MEDTNILLTYIHIEGYSTYEWFETVSDANDFVKESNNISKIIECLDCTNAITLELK